MIEQARITPAPTIAPMSCVSCAGTGYRNSLRCQACGGGGSVLVYQPAIKCPRCRGTGEATPGFNQYPLCIICRGVGWAMVMRN